MRINEPDETAVGLVRIARSIELFEQKILQKHTFAV
jgi:hypothetical protein